MVLELGEVREAMEANELKILDSIVARNKGKTSYYIWKHSNWEGQHSTIMRTKYQLRNHKPPIPLIGTKVWYVDNHRGTISLEWDLGMDIKDADICATDNLSENTLKSAQKFGGAIVHA